MRPPSFPHLSHRDGLDGMTPDRPQRRRFLATALAAAAISALPGCETPTFDPDTTTLTFRRRPHRGSGRN